MLQVVIESQPLNIAVWISIFQTCAVPKRISLVDDSVMVWAYNQLVLSVVVQTADKETNMVCFHNMAVVLFSDSLSTDLASIAI